MQVNDDYVRIRLCIQKFRLRCTAALLEQMTRGISLGDRHFMLPARTDLQLASVLLSSQSSISYWRALR
jgi:hypothetical protein